MIVTENQLDEWVRGNSRIAQGVIVELVWRLVCASSPKPKERRFPLGDSIGQQGPDGILFTEFSHEPFVPTGYSFWEIGTGVDAGAKATEDYRDRIADIPEVTRKSSTFIFVTPLSGRRDWPATWKEDSQLSWRETRQAQREWQDVRVIDGTRLVDWMDEYPAVEMWLAEKMGLQVRDIEISEQRWGVLRTIGQPPPLTPDLFLANRGGAFEKLKEVCVGTAGELQLDTRYPEQMADFVCAAIAAMDDPVKIEAESRCLVVRSADAWLSMSGLREKHILVADFNIDGNDGSGPRLLETARRAGHSVLYIGAPGGVPHFNRVDIPNPLIHQVNEALSKAGHKEERARTLAQKSSGDLNMLLRVLRNLSGSPGWADGTNAGELAISALLGSWNDKSEADKGAAEGLLGKGYGEWIERMRQETFRPATPLTQRDGIWKFVARYEGWYALGPRFFDEQLDRLKKVAVSVLRERDPKFELPPDERFAAGMQGKVLRHSRALRNGIAETLALLGSHPRALTSTTFGTAEAVAVLSVREILADADWHLWASVNEVLPLLAEAAPREFLDSVERALATDPCPFDQVFAQESSGITGGNYTTGLLWALETLAWDPEYLTRVVILLGELASRDPGGKWVNRPSNSLSTLLLPWLPQTCASIQVRKVAVEALSREFPEVAWKLLLTLLPKSHQVSSYSRRPAWREIIPPDWTKGVTQREYWSQVTIYAELAVAAARTDHSKLAELINRWDELPPPSRDVIANHLRTEAVVSIPEKERLDIWTALVDVARKHRKFTGAEWAMKLDEVERIETISQKLAPQAPALRHNRLFSERDHDLFDEKGNYKEQLEKLEAKRREAVREIHATGGIQAVLDFAKDAETPWRVGVAFGMLEGESVLPEILPSLLTSDHKALAQFAGAFVWGRFLSRGWPWVDAVDTSTWIEGEKGQFLAYLPFQPDTWTRVSRLLPGDAAAYWTRCNVNPFATDEDLTPAVDALIRHGRAQAAIGCLHRMHLGKKAIDVNQAARALIAGLKTTEPAGTMDTHDIVEIIKVLQESEKTSPEDLMKVEWGYLSLLDEPRDGYPKFLEQQLATQPEFFFEIIRMVFKSKSQGNTPESTGTPTPDWIIQNGYRLLDRWETPPGTTKEGSYDGKAMEDWLERAKALCNDSGHLDVALSRIGHVLTHAPADPSGLWIHKAAAGALNGKDMERMRDGFKTALYNARGVHSFSSGKEEAGIAARFRQQAGEVEGAGFHRLANSLRELADSYDHDAAREARRNPFGE